MPWAWRGCGVECPMHTWVLPRCNLRLQADSFHPSLRTCREKPLIITTALKGGLQHTSGQLWAAEVHQQNPRACSPYLIAFLTFFVCTESCNSSNVQKKTQFGLIYGTFGLLCHKEVDRSEKILQVSVDLIQIAELHKANKWSDL